MKNTISLKEVHKSLMKNPKFRKAYQTPDIAFEIGFAVTRARIEAGLTQEQLARKAKTKQSGIARLESGRTMPNSAFLYKISKALNKRLEISFVKINKTWKKKSKTK